MHSSASDGAVDQGGCSAKGVALDASVLGACPVHLVELSQLRPTQLAVGMQQVRDKEAKLREKGMLDNPQKRDKFLYKVLHRLPAIKGPLPPQQACATPGPSPGTTATDTSTSATGSGPKAAYYILDHHHLGLALVRAGIKAAYVAEVQDLSMLSWDDFWHQMQVAGRVWAHDQEGNPLTLKQFVERLPTSLAELPDDPYRSLAALVRKSGGYEKSRVPYSEFLWANYLRRHPSLPALSAAASGSEHVQDAELQHHHLPRALTLARSVSRQDIEMHKLPGK